MWVALWITVMMLVHLQFRYCGAVTLVFLKIAEATLIVGAIKLYTEYDEEFVQQIVQSFPKFASSDINL